MRKILYLVKNAPKLIDFKLAHMIHTLVALCNSKKCCKNPEFFTVDSRQDKEKIPVHPFARRLVRLTANRPIEEYISNTTRQKSGPHPVQPGDKLILIDFWALNPNITSVSSGVFDFEEYSWVEILEHLGSWNQTLKIFFVLLVFLSVKSIYSAIQNGPEHQNWSFHSKVMNFQTLSSWIIKMYPMRLI